ncbi:MAG: hypothetical protein NZ765_10415, partial [Anaerolineae bacterium]|nr:hypothetical protein [Anaerolineae bacterium]
ANVEEGTIRVNPEKTSPVSQNRNLILHLRPHRPTVIEIDDEWKETTNNRLKMDFASLKQEDKIRKEANLYVARLKPETVRELGLDPEKNYILAVIFDPTTREGMRIKKAMDTYKNTGKFRAPGPRKTPLVATTEHAAQPPVPKPPVDLTTPLEAAQIAGVRVSAAELEPTARDKVMRVLGALVRRVENTPGLTSDERTRMLSSIQTASRKAEMAGKDELSPEDLRDIANSMTSVIRQEVGPLGKHFIRGLKEDVVADEPADRILARYDLPGPGKKRPAEP